MDHKAKGRTSLSGRIFVIFLSVAGLLLAIKPPATILQIATQTFTGLAVLFPTVLFGLYLKRVYAAAAVTSIVLGEGLMLLFYFKIIQAGGVLPVVWVMLVSFGTYIIIHVWRSQQEGHLKMTTPAWLTNRYVYYFSGLFVLGMDFWAWDNSQPLIFGVPVWIFYFVLLSALQMCGMVFLLRAATNTETQDLSMSGIIQTAK